MVLVLINTKVYMTVQSLSKSCTVLSYVCIEKPHLTVLTIVMFNNLMSIIIYLSLLNIHINISVIFRGRESTNFTMASPGEPTQLVQIQKLFQTQVALVLYLSSAQWVKHKSWVRNNIYIRKVIENKTNLEFD